MSLPHIVIIGAGPGIGASVAHRFAREGFRITLVSRDAVRLGVLANELGDAAVDVISADAADPVAFGEALSRIDGEPTVLVYNAAMLVPTNILTVSAEELAEGYSVDVIGAVIAAQLFVPAMRAAASGTVILTSGSAAVRPSPGIATVSMGKAALRSAATMLAAELAPEGVHVVSVTISGGVKPGTPFDPDLIAETYWRLHTQPPSEWTDEELFDGVESNA